MHCMMTSLYICDESLVAFKYFAGTFYFDIYLFIYLIYYLAGLHAFKNKSSLTL